MRYNMWLTRKHKYDILPEDAQDLIREAPHRSQNRYARALLVTVKIGAIVLLFLAGYVCGTFYPLVSPLGRSRSKPKFPAPKFEARN